MKVRTAAFVGAVGLATMVVVAVAVSVWFVVDRAAQRQVEAELDDHVSVLADVMAYQRVQLHNDARLVADEPRVKALFGAELDIDTIAGEARRARDRVGTALLLMSDADGYLLVDVDHPEDSGTLLLDNPVTGPVIRGALDEGHGDGVWTSDEGVFRVQAQAIRFGAETRGVVLIGAAIDDEVAATIAAQVGSDVAVLLGDRLIASSRDLGEGITSVDRRLPQGDRGPEAREVTLGGKRYLTAAVGFPGYRGDEALALVLLSDLDAALAPGRRVLRLLTIVFVAAVLLAIVLAFIVSRRLSRPIDDLVSFTQVVAGGDLGKRCEARGFREVRQLADSMNHMVIELEQSRELLAEKERLERELQIASRIQTSIVPEKPTLSGYQIATHMATADEVGGDYYDVIETEQGGWIAIGDVSGHGLDAGLIMMMVQTAVASLVEVSPAAEPSAVLGALNRVIFGNIHHRLQVHRHMTLSLLRIDPEGQVSYAGAHMDIVVRRADGSTDLVATRGTWIGIADDIDSVTDDARLVLQAGDMMVLYTDGVTEATDADGKLWGLEGLVDTVEKAEPAPEKVVAAVVDAVDRYQHEQFDDFSLVVARRVGPEQ